MSIEFKTYNRFDVYIFLLIASLVTGNFFGAFQVPRVLAVLFFPPFIRCYGKAYYLIRNMKTWALFFLSWSFLSCLWSPVSIAESLLESGYNVVHILLFFEIILFSKYSKNPIRTISLAFLTTFLMSSCIAFWELITDNHLHMSSIQGEHYANIEGESFLRHFAAVTFHNWNTYTTFICLLLPFLFYGITSKEVRGILRNIFVLAIVFSTIFILYNASRGGILALVIMSLIYYLYSIKLGTGKLLYLIALIILVFFVIFWYGSSILTTFLARASVQGSIENEGRLFIWLNVLKVTIDYFFLGCGAAGIGQAMMSYAKGGVLVPHNIFLEILSQYGILFLGVFIAFLIGMLRSAIRITNNSRKICLYQAIITFPIIGIINSIYLKSPIMWVSMASLYVFANYEHIKFLHKGIRPTA